MKTVLSVALCLVLLSCGKGDNNASKKKRDAKNNVSKIVDSDVKSFATTSLPAGEKAVFACNERIEDHGRKITNRKILYTYRVEEKRTWKKLWLGKVKKVYVYARLLKIDRSRYNSLFEIGKYDTAVNDLVNKDSFSLVKGKNGYDGFDLKLDKVDRVEVRRVILDDFSHVSLKFNRNCTDKI